MILSVDNRLVWRHRCGQMVFLFDDEFATAPDLGLVGLWVCNGRRVIDLSNLTTKTSLLGGGYYLSSGLKTGHFKSVANDGSW